MTRLFGLCGVGVLLVGCAAFDDDPTDWAASPNAREPDAFARGDNLNDVATFHSEDGVSGVALGDDRFGALGMLGAVCSFATADGFIRRDVPAGFRNETVAFAQPEGDGFVSVSFDRRDVAITAFPTEWEGEVRVQVRPGGEPMDAALLDGDLVVLREDPRCLLTRYDAAGEVLSNHVLGNTCVSGLSLAEDGRMRVSSDTAQYELTFDGLERLDAPVERTVHLEDDRWVDVLRERTLEADSWSVRLDGPILGLERVTDGKLLAGVEAGNEGVLVLIDGTTGEVVEEVVTERPFDTLTASPEGGIVAATSRGHTVHMVSVGAQNAQ